MGEKSLLLSTAYFGPVHYYSRIVNHADIYIEQFEHFNKQTYRNRCVILGGNGPITLVVPVIKGRGPKILMKDMRIAYDMDWQRNHWRTIFSAYNSSPYFEYYQDDLEAVFRKKFTFLIDLNDQANQIIYDLLELENQFRKTEDFEQTPESTLNYREVISPKSKVQTDTQFEAEEYTQVFSEKFGFIPNLSILDLLFNEGPNSYSVLERSIKK